MARKQKQTQDNENFMILPAIVIVIGAFMVASAWIHHSEVNDDDSDIPRSPISRFKSKFIKQKMVVAPKAVAKSKPIKPYEISDYDQIAPELPEPGFRFTPKKWITVKHPSKNGDAKEIAEKQRNLADVLNNLSPIQPMRGLSTYRFFPIMLDSLSGFSAGDISDRQFPKPKFSYDGKVLAFAADLSIFVYQTDTVKRIANPVFSAVIADVAFAPTSNDLVHFVYKDSSETEHCKRSTDPDDYECEFGYFNLKDRSVTDWATPANTEVGRTNKSLIVFSEDEHFRLCDFNGELTHDGLGGNFSKNLSPTFADYDKMITRWNQFIAVKPTSPFYGGPFTLMVGASLSKYSAKVTIPDQKMPQFEDKGYLLPDEKTAQAMAFSPDQRTTYSLTTSGEVLTQAQWGESNNFQNLGQIMSAGSPITFNATYMEVSADESVLAILTTNGTILVVDLASMQLMQELKSEDGAAIKWMTFSPDGSMIATGSEQGQMILWKAQQVPLQ